MAEEQFQPGMTYGRYKVPQVPNGMEWLKQFASSDPEGYKKIVGALGGQAEQSFAPELQEYLPGTEVAKPDTTATDAFAKTNVDTGDWFRKNAFNQQPGFLGQIERFQNYIKQGMSPQEAQDRLTGTGQFQDKPVGLEGTAHVDPATGQQRKAEDMYWDPVSATMKPGKASASQVAPAQTPMTLKPLGASTGGGISEDLKQWAISNGMAPAAATRYGWDKVSQESINAIQKAKNLQDAQSTAGTALMEKRTAEGADPMTGFSALKKQKLQETLGNVSPKDRELLLKYSDPINLEKEQRVERKEARAAENVQRFGTADLSSLNKKDVWLGTAGAEFMPLADRQRYMEMGAPGGFKATYGDKTIEDPNTGRETIVGNVPLNIEYVKPKTDKINAIASPLGKLAILLGAGAMTGGVASSMGAGGILSGAAGSLGSMGAGSLMEGRLPSPKQAAVDVAIGAALGGFGSMAKKYKAAGQVGRVAAKA